MKKISVDMVISGASFYGLSMLINTKKNVLLIERGARIGDEFLASLTVNCYEKNPTSEFGKKFLDKLLRDGYIKDGFVCSAPAAFLLAEEAKGKNVMFKTEISKITKTDGEYIITVFNSAGYSEIRTPIIIDTNPEGVFHTEESEKFLNVMCEKETENSVYDIFTQKYIMSFKAKKGEELYRTCGRLMEYLKEKDIGAVYIADAYSYKTEKRKIDDGYYHIPSSCFGNIIDAVDSGGYGYDGI